MNISIFIGHKKILLINDNFFTNTEQIHNNLRWVIVCLFSITTNGYPIKVMVLSISVDKGWDYGHEDNILIINLHNLMIISNNDYEN
jgi:hypothetical protein